MPYFLQPSSQCYVGKKISFNNFTVFLECHIQAVAGWHKAQVDESCLWVSYDLDTIWKSEDFQNACASCSCYTSKYTYLNAPQKYIIFEAILMEFLFPLNRAAIPKNYKYTALKLSLPFLRSGLHSNLCHGISFFFLYLHTLVQVIRHM